MNAVIYYSNTNQSKLAAEYIAGKLKYPLFDIYNAPQHRYNTLILVFPVHCQGIPQAVKSFLKRAEIEFLIPIATFGKICHGNVLFEIQNNYKFKIIAAAYLPAAHTYINSDSSVALAELDPIFKKITEPFTVSIPRRYKNPFASFFPKLRSQIGVKIIKTDDCINCGVCSNICKNDAIINGKINHNCIRCLKCVETCPKKALKHKTSLLMKFYLLSASKKQESEIFI